MRGAHLGAAVEVGDGAGHLEDAVVGARAHVHALDGVLELPQAFGIGLGPLVNHAGRHLGVAVHAGGGAEALRLQLAGLHHAGAYGRRGLAGLLRGQLVDRHGLHLDLQVDAVEQRARYLGQVLLALVGCAYARLLGVAVVAAGAGVHAGHEHKRGWVLDGILGPRDVDEAVFQGLAHHLEHAAVELGQLVEKEHAVVSQAYLARGGVGAAAHQGHGTTTRLCGGNTSFFHEENKEAFSLIFSCFLNLCQISTKLIAYLEHFIIFAQNYNT